MDSFCKWKGVLQMYFDDQANAIVGDHGTLSVQCEKLGPLTSHRIVIRSALNAVFGNYCPIRLVETWQASGCSWQSICDWGLGIYYAVGLENLQSVWNLDWQCNWCMKPRSALPVSGRNVRCTSEEDLNWPMGCLS